jgi:diadenosine tetraphosphate (Ap4A) HIT family hydrolase
MTCELCTTPPSDDRLIFRSDLWRVVHAPDPVVLLGKLYVTLERHAESLGQLTADEATELGRLLQRVVAALDAELHPPRVHVGCYLEEVRHVHLHVTPRTRALPRGNAPAAIAQVVLDALMRVHLRRPVPPPSVDDLVERLRRRLSPPSRPR